MDRKSEDMEPKTKEGFQISTKLYLSFYGCLVGGFILVIALLSASSKPKTIDDMRKISAGSLKQEQKHEIMPGSVLNKSPQSSSSVIPVTANLGRRGDYLVATVRVKNTQDYFIKKSLIFTFRTVQE